MANIYDGALFRNSYIFVKNLHIDVCKPDSKDRDQRTAFQALCALFFLFYQMIVQKIFFRSEDVQIFVFPSCPLFPSISHCS